MVYLIITCLNLPCTGNFCMKGAERNNFMKKIIFLSFIRTIFLFIGMFLICILSRRISGYAFPISWKSLFVIFVVGFFIELIGSFWKISRRKKQSQ